MSLIIKMDTIKTEEHLKKAIPYVMNEAKTNGLHYSNSGVTAGQITDTFFMTKRRFPTRGNRQAYHYKFSFSKDEKISEQDAFSFIREWVEGYLGDDYDFVCSVHQDREHLHMHLVFNSVRRTGGKYHYKKGDWNTVIKPLTNRLADKYHTGHLKEKDETLDYSSDYKKRTKGVDWQARVQSDIDQCIGMSKSYSDFKRKLVSEFHYQLREGVSRDYGVYLSLMPPGKGKAVRSYRLDAGYMPVDIEAKIEGRYVMPEMDGVQNVAMDSHENDAETHKGISLTGKNRKLDWMMSRNYIFIPYKTLSDYQKALVRRTLDAKRLYRRTGTSLLLHEQSVRAIRRMAGETREVGVYRKMGGQQIRQTSKQKEQKKVQREVRKWRKK
ncbi:MAG: relaxase/mobilization nuclease domain-containing protein [Ruminococcus flavefaciens]|nr:relaxase/mobilization nuclease domain-containing protein [Ruminococcus flavefaciens]